MITITLFYCCEKAFVLMDEWDEWEKLNETSLSEKEDFYSP